MDDKTLLNQYIDKCYELIKIREKIAQLARGYMWGKLKKQFPRMSYYDEPIVDDISDIDIDEVNSEIKKFENKLLEETKKIDQIEKEIQELIDIAQVKGIILPFEELAQKYQLSRAEKLALMAIFYCSFFETVSRELGEPVSELFIIEKISGPPSERIDAIHAITELKRKGLIIVTYQKRRLIGDILYEVEVPSFWGRLVQIKPKFLKVFGMQGCLKASSVRTKPKTVQEPTILQLRKPQITIDKVILSQEQRELLNQILFHATKGNKTLSAWGFDKTIKYGKGVVVLLYGPPGTGKTATAEAIACYLKKKLGIVRYEQLLSKWHSESEKNLVLVFKEARETNCVLLFDEADSLFASRLTESHSTDRLHNYMTNILMQELERYDGVVILTTNREYAFDEAFPRRILYKIKFDIPGPAERAQIWRTLMPPEAPLAPDVDFDLLASKYELTGGEIKNVIIKAALECIAQNLNMLTMALLTKYAEAELENTDRKVKNPIGFRMMGNKYPRFYFKTSIYSARQFAVQTS